MKPLTAIPKTVTAFAIFVGFFTSNLFAEGFASMTTVGHENARKLEHHDLSVVRKSHHGKSSITLVVRPAEGHPFMSCSVTAYDKSGEKILLKFAPAVEHVRKRGNFPEGTRISFDIADELIDNLQIRYHLAAGSLPQTHVFTIPRGQVEQVAGTQ